MLNGIITALSAPLLLTFCAFQSKKCSSYRAAICRAAKVTGGNASWTHSLGSGGLALLSEDQTSHSLIWSDLGELSSEANETTEHGWYQSDCVMNESTVFTGNTKQDWIHACE